MTAKSIQKSLRAQADPGIAKTATRFFKTAEGTYGAGDKFLGLRVPTLRFEVTKNVDAPLSVTLEILKSPYHEERLFALLLLVYQFARADRAQQTVIYRAYLKNTRYINNWDLVDSSAYQIVGRYLLDKDANRSVLYKLAESKILWERRISIIATYQFIRDSQYSDTLKLAKVLLKDDEDLIHKAVGWMLREVGNRDRAVEEKYLLKHYKRMPRTMLRYAIEKFAKEERMAYLDGTHG